jgi:hypothetical protein
MRRQEDLDMAIKVKEIELEAEELEAIIAGLRMLVSAPENVWSQYVRQQEHLEDLVTILKRLEVTPSYVIRSLASGDGRA